MSEWQPIETAPMDARILLADQSDVVTGEWYGGYVLPTGRVLWPPGFVDDRYDADHTFEAGKRQPTHWMPIPAPPLSQPSDT